MCRFVVNPFCENPPEFDSSLASEFGRKDIMSLHRSIPDYAGTPLVELIPLADKLGVGRIFVKDESYRFGLKAFKALGASYAIYRYLKEESDKKGEEIPGTEQFYSSIGWLDKNRYTFCTATDGNHGRGVAWVARKLNQRAIIYMPSESVKSRIENIENEGATVILVNGGYDRAVKKCRKDAIENGWQIISDTSWAGYEKIPKWIQAGYITMFQEISDQLENHTIDYVIVQGGVGALLASAVWYFKTNYPVVKIISVEPVGADCLLRSAESGAGRPVSISGHASTIMAGLNCGTPSKVAWPVIQKGVDLFIAISDNYTRDAMREYYLGKPRIISGESGAAGLAAMVAMNMSERLRVVRHKLGISEDSSVLLINTEGDTDPVNFARIINEG